MVGAPYNAQFSRCKPLCRDAGRSRVQCRREAIDASGLTLSETLTGISSIPPMEPNRGMIITGAAGSGSVYKVSTLTGPSSFGSGGFTGPYDTPADLNNPTGTGAVAGISGTDLFCVSTLQLR